MTNKMAETQIKQESKVCKESILTPGVKKHIKSFWVHYLILFIFSLIPLIPFFKNQIGVAQIGQYGDFVGGCIGTIISFITLIVIYTSFKNANDQTLQNTIALLLQSYQHTVEDFDFDCSQGREAIKKSLTLYKAKTQENYISDFFPTHIPAIIVSILYTINDSNYDKKDVLYRLIKTMLSFEERQLLLLYLLELKESDNNDDKKMDYANDKKLLAELIFTNGKTSKALKGFEDTYNKIYEDGKQNK